jgi:putative ABC transport system permease protein
MTVTGWIDSLRQDIRFALRALRKNPGFSLVALATLAIGIGANTAIFSVVEAVLLRPPAYRDADRLVLVWHRMRGLGGEQARVAGPDVVAYGESSRAIQSLAFTNGAVDVTLQAGDRTEHLRVGSVTPNFFELLGVAPALGRTFRPGEAVLPTTVVDDDAFEPPPSVLVLGHNTWKRLFGADSSVIGRTVRLSGAPMTVVGVAPPGFALRLPPGAGLPTDIDAWTPLRIPLDVFRRPERLRDQDSDNTGAMIGRLANGARLETARAELEAVATRLREQVPQYRHADLQVDVVPLTQDAVRHARPALLALMGAVGFVLLIACINVANLLLARGMRRRGEMAVRAALGAKRPRLVRQMLTESFLLAVAGAGIGVLAAYWMVDLLLILAPAELPGADSIGMNATVLGFTAGITLLSTLIFGAWPATAIVSAGQATLRGTSARGGGTRTARFRTGLVVAEIALSLALLVGAGLMLRSFARLQRVDPGFEPDGLLTFQVNLPGRSVGGPAARAEFMHGLEERIGALPNVGATGLVGGLPLGGVVWTQPYGPEGTTPAEWSRSEANFRVITSDYFRAMGTRLLAGRAFMAAEDLLEDERVVIVDERAAERLARGGPVSSALGRRIGFPLDGRPVWATIVGVVENVDFETLGGAGRETLYVPYRQEASRSVTMAVRTAGPVESLVPTITTVAAELEAGTDIPIFGFRAMQEYVDRALAPTRFALALLGLFAGMALVLAAVGIFGVVSYGVRLRTREFGIRLALGATSGDVVRSVLRRAIILAAAGVLVGLGVAAATSRALEGLLFEVSTMDLFTYVAVAALLVLVAVFASWTPARRAARVEPVVALRHE